MVSAKNYKEHTRIATEFKLHDVAEINAVYPSTKLPDKQIYCFFFFFFFFFFVWTVFCRGL